ncbi:hypothetical protein ACFWNN_23430 [Lentzea sp. NPDC058450]
MGDRGASPLPEALVNRVVVADGAMEPRFGPPASRRTTSAVSKAATRS